MLAAALFIFAALFADRSLLLHRFKMDYQELGKQHESLQTILCERLTQIEDLEAMLAATNTATRLNFPVEHTAVQTSTQEDQPTTVQESEWQQRILIAEQKVAACHGLAQSKEQQVE